MNFSINLIGLDRKSTDICAKLIKQSAEESDYVVKIHSAPPLSPYDALNITIYMVGGKKAQNASIVVDFDNLVLSDEADILFSPALYQMELSPTGEHYWGILGRVFKAVDDMSTAYVTGYFLNNNMKREMAVFNDTAYNPAANIQIQEALRDKDFTHSA